MGSERLPPNLTDLLVEETGNAERVTSLYEPIAAFCWEQASTANGTFVIGVSGPQGSGKTTLTTSLANVFTKLGRPALTVSLDDFYLTRQEQLALARAHPGDRLLEHRGYPGTHDVELARSTLASLKRGEPTRVPVYDKSAHGGRGDRAPTERFRTIHEPLAVVFFEGWMLGFEALEESACPPLLRATNELLRAYPVLGLMLDAFVLLEASSLEDIVGYRVDAERARRERGETALTDEEARDYIERFIPAYRAYLPGLRLHPPGRAAIRAVLGSDRRALRIGTLPDVAADAK